MPEIIAICLAKRAAILDNGVIAQITDMIDTFGEETDAPDEAVAFVAHVHGKWYSGLCGDFEFAKLH